MRIFAIMLGLLLSMNSLAEIYSWKDSNGNTVFGDTPPESLKAKKIEPQPLTVIPGYRDPELAANQRSSTVEAAKEDEIDTGYESFKVAFPENDAAIRSEDGNISVSFELSPGLKPSDYVFIYLDGKKVVEDSKSLSTSFQNLDRGTHSMFAVIRNENGDVLINSNTVSFHVQRNSVINSRVNKSLGSAPLFPKLINLDDENRN